MKSNKWLTYILGVLLTLVVLAAVGGIGFRMGVMQSASFANLTDGQSVRASFFAHGMDDGFNQMDQMERSNSSHGFDRSRGGDRDGFSSPIFGLIPLLVFGVLAWFGYKLIKNSGWKLVKVNASEAPAPVVETPSEAAAGGEEKETE